MRTSRVILFLFFILFASAPFARSRELPSIFEDLETSGASKEIIEELEGYISKNPGADYIDEALFRLARAYAEKKDFGKAAYFYQKVIEGLPASKFRFDASYELGVARYRAGQIKDAKAALEAVSTSREAGIWLRIKASRLIREIDSALSGAEQKNDGPAIGVLLPLKGSYTQFGEEALNGVLLAAGVFGKGEGSIEVFARNVGTDPSSVEAAVSELSSNSRVAGLVGPLLSVTAGEAARYAQMKKIPVITLSQKDGVTEAGDYVFRNFLTPSVQASALAQYACGGLGKKRLAILHPQNNYGIELAKLFTKEAEVNGCSVVRSASYPQGQTDFSPEIKRIFGVQVKERKEGRRVIKEFTPTVNIDAVFIPDSYEAVSLIAPYFGYYNITGIQLFGPNSWNSPRLVELGGKSVEGAVFVDGFFAESNKPETVDFTKRFKEAYGRSPGVIEAQAYDAAMMLISAIKEGGKESGREALKDRLKSVRGFKGATGSIYFDSRNEPVKRLFFLTVRDGRVVEAQVK
ncbi:MAG: penicillin-binding protein activator [Deltaproteobacteria bacterium]|nr:penicillin-binding protein activator [Deltaproteobacteria bacterium]